MIAFRADCASARILRPAADIMALPAGCSCCRCLQLTRLPRLPATGRSYGRHAATKTVRPALTACMAIINTRGIPARERATAYYNRCYHYILGHDYRNALANCDRSLEDNPSFVDAWLNRSTIRSGLGQFDLAIKDATQALAMANNNWDRAGALRNRAAAFVRRGKIAESQADLDQAADCNLAMSTISSTGQTSCCNSAVPMRRSTGCAGSRNPRPP